MAEGGIELHDYTVPEDSFDDQIMESPSIQQEIQLSQTVDNFYQSLEEEPYHKDYNAFELDGKSLIHTNKEGRKTVLTNQKTGEFLAKSTLRGRFGGTSEMRKSLNLQTVDKRSLSKEGFKKFQEFQEKLPPNVERIPLNDLPSETETILN